MMPLRTAKLGNPTVRVKSERLARPSNDLEVPVSYGAHVTAQVASTSRGVPIRWRTLEWWGAGIALFLMSGALFPLLMSSDGNLDAAVRLKLELLSVPSYGVTVMLMARHPRQLGIALSRNLPLILLLLLPFFSVMWSIYPTISLKRSIALALSTALCFVIAVRFTPRQLLLLLGWVIGPCVVLSLVFAVAIPHLGWMQDGAMRGIFIHKNVLGWYSGLGVLVFASIAADPALASRRVSLPLLAGSVLCLVGSQSMTSMLSVASAVGFATFYRTLERMRGSGRMLLVLLFIQLVALLLVVVAYFLVPFLAAIGKDATLTGRVPLWALVDQDIGRRLFLGYGYQAFWTDANPAAWRIWSAIGWQAPHAHNGYRDTLLSLGVVGLVLLLAVIVRGIRQGAQMICRAPGEGWVWLNTYVAMMLVVNLTESNFLVQNDLLFILFVTALIMFAIRLPETRRRAQ